MQAGGLQCADISNATFISPHRLLKVARLYLEENWGFEVEMNQKNLYPSSRTAVFLHLSAMKMESLDVSVLCDFSQEDADNASLPQRYHKQHSHPTLA